MSGLGHYLEREGIATVCIALVREHAAAMRPPRALWVPFPLGRPFGVPDDAAFQRRVLEALLALLDRPAGPVLEDFPDDAPAEATDVEESAVCPVSFAGVPAAADLGARVASELARLRVWYERGLALRGRTGVGLAGISPAECARCLARFAESGDTGVLPAGPSAQDALRWAAEDLKAFYTEAVLAQPGRVPGAAVARWLWQETALAELLRSVRRTCLEAEDPALRDTGAFMLMGAENAG